MTSYLHIFSRRAAAATAQALPIPGTVPNAAGGHAFAVDDWARLDRFLILGSEGGSYYAGERLLTRDNAAAVLRTVAADGLRAVARIAAISKAGRAPKNGPALFALALAASADDLPTRRDRIAPARLHPLAILLALRTYAGGRGDRGGLQWEPVQPVIDALNAAFYTAFAAVEPTGKRLLLALDVSGSMAAGRVAGSSLTPREASAAMALMTAATEANTHVVGFGAAMVPLPLSPSMRLDDAMRAVSGLPFGATDCAQPMLYALDRGLSVDAFVVCTDSETWAGAIHPVQALRRYRERTGIAAKLVVVGLVSNGFSIADPADAGMLDVVGFDAAAPAVIADFIRR